MLLYILLSVILSSIAVYVAGNVMSGVHLKDFGTAVIVAVVLGLINTFIRPILLILTLPINILTLGLFTFVIMGFTVWLVAQIVPGFQVDSFWWAMGFAIILAIINAFLSAFKP